MDEFDFVSNAHILPKDSVSQSPTSTESETYVNHKKAHIGVNVPRKTRQIRRSWSFDDTTKLPPEIRTQLMELADLDVSLSKETNSNSYQTNSVEVSQPKQQRRVSMSDVSSMFLYFEKVCRS